MTLFQTHTEPLLFQRNAIMQGEIWRIITGNLVHTNHYHLFLNLAGLGFIWILFKSFLSLRVFYVSLFLTTLGVGLGIFFLSKELAWYAGLSGALYGLFIIASSLALRCKDYLLSLPILIGLPIKLVWDVFNDDLTQSSAKLIEAPIATDAHIYGAATGLAVSLALLIFHKPKC